MMVNPKIYYKIPMYYPIFQLKWINPIAVDEFLINRI